MDNSPIFVHREVTLTGLDWMAMGMRFAGLDSFIFPRDYLVPFHNESWTGFYPKVGGATCVGEFHAHGLGEVGNTQTSRWSLAYKPGHVALHRVICFCFGQVTVQGIS